ncbi:MAG: hypothetical protein GYB65_22520 [Chloroflexi bacterium]|nr:hypothetical protein [Chloroflexota bacterium]
MPRRRLFPVLVVLALVAAGMLAACGDDDDSDPPTLTPAPTIRPSQAPPPTVIVPFEPTDTPLPPTPLPYFETLEPKLGEWALRIDVELTDLSLDGGPELDKISYSTVVLLRIDQYGAITGRETTFDPETQARLAIADDPEAEYFGAVLADVGDDADITLDDAPVPIDNIAALPDMFSVLVSKTACNPETLNEVPLVFRASGNISLDDTGLPVANVTMIPYFPNQPERYRLVCQGYNEEELYQGSILWSVLEALDGLELITWRFPLESYSPPPLVGIDLASLGTDPPMSGQLELHMSFSRN